MDISYENDKVVISVKGTKFLKLKASLYNQIGNALVAEKDRLVFPLNCFDIVKRQIPEIEENIKDSSGNIFDLHSKAREIAISSLNSLETKLVTSGWKEILDIPQQYAVNSMITPNLLGLCLFDEQGSGKTVMTISSFDILKENHSIDTMIIICPKSMINGWYSDIAQFTHDKYNILVSEGSINEKRRAVLDTTDVLIMNYENVSPLLVPLNALSENRSVLLVVDESYYVKSDIALRYRSLVKLRSSCRLCFVLCGTPAPNSPYDLISQFNLADQGFTFSTFAKGNDLEIDKAVIRKLINERGLYIRRLKNEILENVPDKVFNVISVPLAGYQKTLYEQAKKQLELQLRTYDNRSFKKSLSSYFQKRSAMLQICSVPSNIDPTFSGESVKYKALDTLLSDLISQKRKVIIWSYYKASIVELKNRYAKFSPLIIDGDTSTTERKDAVLKFQNDENYNLFIANPSAAGSGLTLHSSYDAIYVSFSNQAAHYLQSLDRIHRRGQKSKRVNYYLLICENTLEETEVMRLRNRELQQHDLLGDFYTFPSSLDEALSELARYR